MSASQIEVKGGRVSRDAQGWYQEGRGQRHRIDPVRQAQDGRHALTRYLARHAAEAARSRAAHLVAFPFTSVPAAWEAPDCPRAIVLDRDDVRQAATRVRAAIERRGAGHQPLTPAGLESLVEALAAQLPWRRLSTRSFTSTCMPGR